MPVMLQVQNLRKTYGARVLLDDCSASFGSDQKIGVIGRNGAGKSTLCKIIIGTEEKDSGQIIKNSDLRMAYLEQHDPYKVEETVADFLVRYTSREEWECGEMAHRFEIDYDKLHAPIGSLSGGYRTRVKLAAMLLRNPNFLILDEPTNYLDLSTLILLEHFLQEFRGGYLVVSHDREFLKKTCDHTLEIDMGRATLYPGDVEEYFDFKAENRRQVEVYNKSIEKKKAEMQSFVDRFKAKASTAARAQSRMKAMAKLKTIEVAHSAGNINIRIPQVEKKGGVALDCQDLSIGYPDKLIASKIHFDIERGSKVAILGDNGQGKTTFLRTISADLAPKSGAFKWGYQLKVATYAQHVFQSLHKEDTVISHLSRHAAQGVSMQDILDMAGCFLFKGDDVQKKIPVLSGGERARVILAGLLLDKNDVLLLDEPTNHLDFETVEALGAALKTFNGTLFFISHDRTFVNMVADQILEVKDGGVRKYPGTYEDYVYSLETKHSDDPTMHAPQTEGLVETAKPIASVTQEEEEETPARKEIRKKMTSVKIQANKVESRIERLQKDRQKLEDDSLNFSKEKIAKLKELEAQIKDSEEEWLQLSQDLEKLQQQLEGK